MGVHTTRLMKITLSFLQLRGENGLNKCADNTTLDAKSIFLKTYV